MNWPWSKPKAPARQFISATRLGDLILEDLGGIMRSRSNLWIGDSMFCTTSKAELAAIAKKAWKPWFDSRGGGNCDAQARRVKVYADEEMHAQRLEAPLAIGSFWTAGPSPHAYTFGVLETLELVIYDQTTGWWLSKKLVDNPLTLVVV